MSRVFPLWLKVKGSNEAVTVVIVRSGKQVGNISLTYPVAYIMKKRSLLWVEATISKSQALTNFTIQIKLQAHWNMELRWRILQYQACAAKTNGIFLLSWAIRGRCRLLYYAINIRIIDWISEFLCGTKEFYNPWYLDWSMVLMRRTSSQVTSEELKILG